MPEFEDGCYTCNTGIALIGKLLAGRLPMKYTRVALGSGQIPAGERPRTLSAPPGYVMDGAISAVTVPQDGECNVTVQVDSAMVEHGFYLTGLMLYAEDPDLGEVPYTYMSLANEPEWIRPKTSTIRKINTFNLIAEVDAVENVTAVFDESALITYNTLCRVLADAMRMTRITVTPEMWTMEGERDAVGVVSLPWATADMVPCIHVNRSCTTMACECGLELIADVEDGALHLYAARIPMEPLIIELLCLRPALDANWTPTAVLGPAPGEGGTSAVLLPATETRLGGVRVGAGLTGGSDGTLSVDYGQLVENLAVPDEEFTEALRALQNETEE